MARLQLVLFAIEQTNSVHQTIIIPFTEMIAHISVWLVMLFAGSRYFCESLFWASQPKQAAKT
ncbi:hypothetical protein BMR03_06995 [Methylococcaceae bacterium HT2]|nr:hypothetical protein BMR06_11260 [Methylococcaceae bacterium HT5]TXL22679.1 hypothetical protein BMR03_06995 [Methylococcaceae bacterium HT2]